MTTGYFSDGTLLGIHFSSNGLPGGTLDMIGDYSGGGVGATDFYIEAQAGEILLLNRFMIYVEDSGAFAASKYGYNLTLNNGLKFYTKKGGGSRISLIGGQAIKTNSQIGLYCYDVYISSYGTGTNSLSSRWSFDKYGPGITLLPGEQFGVHLEDDFSDLIAHRMFAEGEYIGTPTSTWQIVI